MAGKPTLMVQIADRAWTLDAVHCACRMARQTPADIALVTLIPVQHIAWLGTDWGHMNFSEQQFHDLEDYRATVLDYGLSCKTVCFQYSDFFGALAEAAEDCDAQVVFAHLPGTRIPARRRFLLWLLNRRLSNASRRLIERPADVLELMPMTDARARELSHL